jgi:hypothetical protein
MMQFWQARKLPTSLIKRANDTGAVNSSSDANQAFGIVRTSNARRRNKPTSRSISETVDNRRRSAGSSSNLELSALAMTMPIRSTMLMAGEEVRAKTFRSRDRDPPGNDLKPPSWSSALGFQVYGKQGTRHSMTHSGSL